ncbi:TFIIA-alpha and beta-like factor [Polymixia lowei]
MLTNTGPVPKLYLSVIEDVIESMRDLFLDEGLEDRVLDDLRQLWESKLMQSKALEDFRKSNINSSKFVLQLPANYSRPDQELTASVVIPSQNIHSFPVKKSSETLATFSLPAGLSYPVQIPAGVTLQTASGQLYKVNVPVVVTQAPAGNHPFSQPTQKVIEWREAPVRQPAIVPPAVNTIPPQDMEPCTVSATCIPQSPEPNTISPQESILPQQPQVRPAEDPEPQLLNLEVKTVETLTQVPQFNSSDVEDILKEVIEEKRDEAELPRNLTPPNTDQQSEAFVEPKLDNYSELSDIIQLDGPADNSDIEEDDGVPLEENDFLGMINAEAMKALQEVDGSSDGNSISSSSDHDEVDELANIEEEDPLNSGDDVIEQDIPDLFDTDNVIVCQYDKIHRSKNRWKFHLKDGVMCYGGRDYVFSKAIGEAEW